MDIWLLPWDDFLHNDIQPDIQTTNQWLLTMINNH